MSMWKPTLPPYREHKSTVFTKAAQVADFIYQIGETPLLRQRSREISPEKITNEETKEKITYLKMCLLRYREITGVGRAITAVQIGIPECFTVIHLDAKLWVIINPRVTKLSDKLLLYPEICMSANPIIAPTVRPSWVEFSYYDEEGVKRYWQEKDTTTQGTLLNRVLLHEIDHMEGIMNIDKVKSPRDLILDSDPAFYESATFQEASLKDR